MKLLERGILFFERPLRLLCFLACATVLSSAVFAQRTRSFGDGSIFTKEKTVERTALASEAGTQPTSTFSTNGDLNCKAYSQLGRADNVVGGRELALDFGGTYSTTFEYRDYVSPQGVVDLIGTTATSPPGTVTVSTNSNTLLSFMTAKQITAVILRDGTRSYVFVYDIGGIHYTNDGMNLSTNGAAITGISFCFNQSVIPTAADVSVSGRVLTPSGRAVGGARITITDGSTGEVFSAMTSPFGYYTVEGLEAGGFYIATVAKKGVKFETGTRAFTLNDSLADMDFVSNQ